MKFLFRCALLESPVDRDAESYGLTNIFMLLTGSKIQSKVAVYLMVKVEPYHEADSPPEANKDKSYITLGLLETAVSEVFPTISFCFDCNTFLARGSGGRIMFSRR